MLLFAHTGITTGIVKACDILGSISEPVDNYQPHSGSWLSVAIRKRRLSLYQLLNRAKDRIGLIDYRLVLLGSLLPDIFDKPLWLFAGSNISPSGCDYAHTFLLNLVLLISGLALVRYKKPQLLVISSSSFMHLILDRMWDNPITLWWPLLGPFQRVETTGWLPSIIYALSSDPGTYIPEIIGLVIISLLGYRLLMSKNIMNFIRTGTIG